MDALGFVTETPVKLESWCKALLDAADYIEQHGWCQGRYGKDGGPRCASGAILSVSDEGSWQLACERFKKVYDCAPCTFNDVPGRTVAEVCAALRYCTKA